MAVSARQLLGVELNMQRWLQHTELLAVSAEAGLLPRSGDCRAVTLVLVPRLEAELREILRGVSLQDLRRAARRLYDGGTLLARAAAVLSPRQQAGAGEAMTAGDEVVAHKAPAGIRAIVTEALRAAEEQGQPQSGAREALLGEGLLDLAPGPPAAAREVGQAEARDVGGRPRQRRGPRPKSGDPHCRIGPLPGGPIESGGSFPSGRSSRCSRPSRPKTFHDQSTLEGGLTHLQALRREIRSARPPPRQAKRCF